MNRIGEQLTMVPRILARVLEPGWVMAGLPLRLALMLAQEASGCGPSDAGSCPVCDATVTADEPHIRFRGAVYHAEPCAESCPPAETATRQQMLRSAFGPRDSM